MLKNLNLVKERFLPLPQRVEAGLEKELSLSDFDDRELIGSGSFGCVYEALNKMTKIKVAIKALNKGLIKKEHNLPQVQREISLMYQMQHPNIVKLYTHFEDEDNLYLVMELITNKDLLEKLKKQDKGYLPEKEALKYITQIVKALKYLHSQNPPIIHRDLKPENVLIDKDDNCKLADFGSANQKVLTATFVGTPLYMAPEMLLKNEYDQHLDIWCLGVLIYELLSGEPPFNVPQNLDKLDAQAVLTKNILELGLEFPKWFPTLAKDLLEKMLNKDPKKRPNILEVEAHQWIKSNESIESQILEESRLRSRSLRYGYFAEIKGHKRKNLNAISEELTKCALEVKSHKILEDINKNMSNLLEQLNETKVKFEVWNMRYNKMNWFYEKIEKNINENIPKDEFLEKVNRYKELIEKKEELNNKLKAERQEFQKLEETGFNLEFEILKSQQDYDILLKDKLKIKVLDDKKSELILKKDEVIKEIETKSEEIKQKKIENEQIQEFSSTRQDLLSHFLMKANYLRNEHKKISFLQDNKNSRYLEMKKELLEIDKNFTKKKEELEKQANLEYDEGYIRMTNDFEREKQFLEDDYISQKNQLEKKIQKLKIQNYTLNTKVHIDEETYKPRLESLNQLIDKYQENKLTLENIIGQKEKKFTENKEDLVKNEEILEKKKKKHKFTNFLYGSFGGSSDKKEKSKDRKSNLK